MLRFRASFYEDGVGQKLVDVVESLALGNVSLAWTGFSHAISAASEMYANDALDNGKGDWLRAIDHGGGNAMKVTAFRRSMNVLGNTMPPKTRALFGVVVDALVDDMREKAVDRIRKESQAQKRDSSY